jgi:hypothetical protein
MNLFLIEEQLAQSVLNYLAQRPYHEVFQLIAELQQIKPATPEPQQPIFDEMVQAAHREAEKNNA